MRGRDKPRVALAATSAARYQETVAGCGEIVQALAGRFVVDHRAHRHLQVDRMAFGARAIAAFSMPAALRLVLGIETGLDESGVVFRGNHADVAAAPAIAAARAAARNVLLAAKGQAAVPAIPGLHQDASFIDKHGENRRLMACEYVRCARL